MFFQRVLHEPQPLPSVVQPAYELFDVSTTKPYSRSRGHLTRDSHNCALANISHDVSAFAAKEPYIGTPHGCSVCQALDIYVAPFIAAKPP